MLTSGVTNKKGSSVPNVGFEVVSIHFVTIGASGDDGPVVTMRRDGHPARTVEILVSRAIQAGGVWDLPKKVFHPWHAVIRVSWILREASKEEVEQATSRNEMKQTQSESRI